MADENIVTNIVANADFSGLIADVNKVTASLSKLQVLKKKFYFEYTDKNYLFPSCLKKY